MECIDYFQEMLQLSLKTENKDCIIWCNDKYRFNGIPLFFKHWSKSGFKVLSDLYDLNGDLANDVIHDHLIRKAGFIFEMSQITKTYPPNLTIHHSRVDRDIMLTGNKAYLLQQIFSVPEWGDKPLSELTSKDLYKIFLMTNAPDIKTKPYWVDNLGVETVDWDTWISVNLVNKLIPKKTIDFNWKILHRLVNSGAKLRLMNLSDGVCKRCQGQNIENLQHLLFNCKESKILWEVIQKVIQDYLGRPIALDKTLALTGLWQSGVTQDILITNMILGITRHHIWKIRCKIWYGGEKISTNLNLRILKSSLLNHVQLLISSKTTQADLINNIIMLKTEIEKIAVDNF